MTVVAVQRGRYGPVRPALRSSGWRSPATSSPSGCSVKRPSAAPSRAATRWRQASTRHCLGLPVALYGVGYSLILDRGVHRVVRHRGPPCALRRVRAWPGRHRRGRLPDLSRAVRHRSHLHLVRDVRRDHRGRLGRGGPRRLANIRGLISTRRASGATGTSSLRGVAVSARCGWSASASTAPLPPPEVGRGPQRPRRRGRR